ALCRSWELKGTILLSTEGINLFVAGAPEKIDLLLAELRTIPGLENFEVKISESDHQPFNRMLVRLKKEIIAFGVEGIDPAKRTSPKLPAKTLKQWLDEGKPVTLLDTRNDYEVK
ncbi:MAG: pseudouridine synthase, partial [Limisphaerales bacterium]